MEATRGDEALVAHLAGIAEAYRRGRAAEGDFPLSDPDVIFGYTTYLEGALVFHALRWELGDDVFADTIDTYLERYHHEVAGIADFRAIAEEVSGRDLSRFFAEWWGERLRGRRRAPVGGGSDHGPAGRPGAGVPTAEASALASSRPETPPVAGTAHSGASHARPTT